MTTKESLLHLTSQTTGVHLNDVEKVVQALSYYTAHLFEEKAAQAVRWPHVGTFRCKPERLVKLGLPPTTLRAKKDRYSPPSPPTT